MTETTVKAPAAEAKAPKEPTPTPVKVGKAFSDAPTWAHLRFVEWAEANGIDNIDDVPAVQVVAATTRLYNVFRAEPAFIAERETQRAERATKTKAEKPLSEMTPDEAAKELDKIQAAQKQAQERAAKQAKRAQEIQQMLADAGVAPAVTAEADEADEATTDEDADAAF
jgi:hypothetical protein